MSQKITPCLWYDNNAEQAAKYYVSVFPESKIKNIEHYGKAEADESGMPEGSVMTVSFELNGNEFLALNGGSAFKLSEAVSFMIECKDQAEIDYYYEKLSAVPESEVCGWLKDKFGVSWQIMPKDFDKMMSELEKKKKQKVMGALLKMKRINLKELKDAAE